MFDAMPTTRITALGKSQGSEFHSLSPVANNKHGDTEPGGHREPYVRNENCPPIVGNGRSAPFVKNCNIWRK